MLLALLQDKFFVEHVAFLEPRILLGEFLAHILRLLLTIAHRGEALFLYAVFYQVVYYRLGAALRQMLVIFAVSLVVAMGAEFNGNVRVLFQQRYQLVEGCCTGFGKGCLVEIVEDVVDEYRGCDGSGNWSTYSLLSLAESTRSSSLWLR